MPTNILPLIFAPLFIVGAWASDKFILRELAARFWPDWEITSLSYTFCFFVLGYLFAMLICIIVHIVANALSNRSK